MCYIRLTVENVTKTKCCLKCGTVFEIPYGYSAKQTLGRRYCTQKCAVADRPATHYKKGWSHSDETKQKISKRFKGIFRSETYGSIHTWLLKNFKKTNCEQCGSDRFVEFALKQNHVHEHKRENYLCLCSSCHKKYDYTEERKKKLSQSLTGRKILWVDKIAQKEITLRRERNHLGQYA